MTAKLPFNALFQWAMPMKNNRHLVVRTVKKKIQSLETIPERVNRCKLDALGLKVNFRHLEAPGNFVMDGTCSLPFDRIERLMRRPSFAAIMPEKLAAVATR